MIPAFVLLLIPSAVWARRVRGSTRAHIAVRFLAAAACALFISATLTPSRSGAIGSWHRNFWFSGDLRLPTAGELTSLNETSLNIAVAVPLGLGLALLAARSRSERPLFAGVAMIAGVELIQTLLPVLGRSGFALEDVALNLFGFAVGALIGRAAVPVLTGTRSSTRAERAVKP